MQALEASFSYHIYNRGNNKQDVFFEEDNYRYYLQLLAKHILPISEIYAYCLLPNHFHLLLCIKANAEAPSKAMSNFINAYTKAINKKYNRTGSLFQKPFKRIKISEEKYLINLIKYIHQNPENHGLSNDFQKYSKSSYQSLLSEKTTKLDRDFVINLFGDRENFIFSHRQKFEIEDSYSLE